MELALLTSLPLCVAMRPSYIGIATRNWVEDEENVFRVEWCDEGAATRNAVEEVEDEVADDRVVEQAEKGRPRVIWDIESGGAVPNVAKVSGDATTGGHDCTNFVVGRDWGVRAIRGERSSRRAGS